MALRWIGSKPYWLHLPLIALLFLLCLERAGQTIRRYRNNLRAKKPPFTVIEGALSTTVGLLFATSLSGSLSSYWTGMSREGAEVAAVWFAALVLFAATAAIMARIEPTLPAPRTADATAITDNPITEDTEDTLGRLPFVNDLYAEIKDFPFDESTVFGLNGRWGTGKTSVLNLLRNRLRRDKGIILVEFNPWYFTKTDVLVHRFYSAVATAINKEFFFPDLASLARRYSTILAPVLKRLGLEMNVGALGVEDVKAQVERYILQTGRRVVVVIDDIDRTEAKELLWVFRTVRLTAEFKKTTFLLAYDENQICSHLKKLHISQEYLEKIVQNPIQLPAIDPSSIDRFVLYSDASHRSQLDKLFDKLNVDKESRAEFDKKIVEVYPSHLRPFLRTLRSSKRFLNGLGARLPVVLHEVYLLDFVLLEVLRLFAPRVYQDMYDNRHYYIPEWTWEAIRTSPFGIAGRSEKDEFPRKVKAHVDDLLKDEPLKEGILEILKEIFFARVKSAFDSGAWPTHSDNFAVKARAKKRLTHPESFEKYFLLSVPRGLIPDKVIEDTFKSWALAPDPSALIRGDFVAYQKQGDLRKFLDSILLFLEKMDDKSVEPLLNLIGSDIQMFSREGHETSEYDGAFKLALFLLSDKIKEGDKRGRLEQILQDTPAIEFAIKIVSALAGRQVGLYSLQQATDLPAAKLIVSSRLRKEVIDAGVDIFQTNPQFPYVLFQTGTYSDEAKEMVNAYVLRLCSRNPSYIGKLVGGFFMDFGDNSGFNLSSLRQVYDSRALAALARTAGKSAWSDDKEERAVQQLLLAEPEPDPTQTPSSDGQP